MSDSESSSTRSQRSGSWSAKQELETRAGLWPIRRALMIASTTAVVALASVMLAVLAILGFPHVQSGHDLPLPQLLDVLKLVLGTVAGAGALFALVVAYRRQRLAEVADERDQRRALDDLTRVFNERFAAAAQQLGHAEPAVRLAGAHAMAGLADDWEHGRQTCIDVLCAYLQLPYEPEPSEDAQASDRLVFARNRRVRITILDIITAHLRDGVAPVSWQGHNFNFDGTVFDYGNFTGVRFTGGLVRFMNAEFRSASFANAHFAGGDIYFSGATFSEGRVDFDGARFTGGKIEIIEPSFQGGVLDLSRSAVWEVPPLFGSIDPGRPPEGLKLPADPPSAQPPAGEPGVRSR